MKELIVKKANTGSKSSWTEVGTALESSSWNNIDVVNWPEYNYRPWVQFRMVYSDTEFLLQYQVKEKYIRAVASRDNGEVWKDSCVEFFVMPADDGVYYNFEFNCAGVCLLAAGTGRSNRKPASMDTLGEIRRLPSLGKIAFQERKGDADWSMSLAIPYTCLFQHPGYSPEGKIVHANFYKCGDDLTEPHFLSWNPIKTEKPDFHRPEFFGKVKFE
ncbi:MAG: hypothetical protein LBQ60_20505 [Bacteroidales bacterium]|jgi:hypothetical protein|nr:hypothetical protein [Bacteroidales bacterium]